MRGYLDENIELVELLSVSPIQQKPFEFFGASCSILSQRNSYRIYHFAVLQDGQEHINALPADYEFMKVRNRLAFLGLRSLSILL